MPFKNLIDNVDSSISGQQEAISKQRPVDFILKQILHLPTFHLHQHHSSGNGNPQSSLICDTAVAFKLVSLFLISFP